jgi:hypothetical protein
MQAAVCMGLLKQLNKQWATVGWHDFIFVHTEIRTERKLRRAVHCLASILAETLLIALQ